MTQLSFVPKTQFDHLTTLNCTPADKTRIFATLCRINTLYMIAKAGSGHIGSSFSSLDIVTWLHLNELRDGDDDGAADIYFSSKGHDVPALYSVMIMIGVLDWDLLHKLRRIDGLPGHPDVETPCIVTNTGSLGMGISKAKGMVSANRLEGRDDRVYVLLGDGELQEGQLWESLVSAANREMGEIIAIVDHNKIQSDTWVDSVCNLGNLDAKFASYGWHVERIDGHDFGQLSAALENAKSETQRPSMIIADTIKGKGVSFMEWGIEQKNEPLYPYHSGALSVEDYDSALSELTCMAQSLLKKVDGGSLELETIERAKPAYTPKVEKLIEAYSRALVEQGSNNPKLVCMDADLVLDTGQIPFRETFPDRFIECGIAEQDMVSQAGGLALNGYLPVVHSFACFLSTRPNEQIYNNATEGTKIIYVGSLAGLLPGMPGHSHQSVRDIACLTGVPGLTMIQPSCEVEVEMTMDYAVNENQACSYIRLVSIPCALPFELPGDYIFAPGKGAVLTEGNDAVVFAYGPIMLGEAVKAAKSLKESSRLGVKVVNLPWLNRIDHEWLKETVSDTKAVFTIDDHYLEGGQGERIAAAIAESGMAGLKVTRFGINEIPACGQNGEVLSYHGLDKQSLVRRISEVLESI
jgi:transketolase